MIKASVSERMEIADKVAIISKAKTLSANAHVFSCMPKVSLMDPAYGFGQIHFISSNVGLKFNGVIESSVMDKFYNCDESYVFLVNSLVMTIYSNVGRFGLASY